MRVIKAEYEGTPEIVDFVRDFGVPECRGFVTPSALKVLANLYKLYTVEAPPEPTDEQKKP